MEKGGLMPKPGRPGVDRPWDLDDDMVTPFVTMVLERIAGRLSMVQRWQTRAVRQSEGFKELLGRIYSSVLFLASQGSERGDARYTAITQHPQFLDELVSVMAERGANLVVGVVRQGSDPRTASMDKLTNEAFANLIDRLAIRLGLQDP